MSQAEIARDIIAQYARHGWKLQRVLMRSATRAELESVLADVLGAAVFLESEVDALWFARPSHAQREAWELRLISEQPFALFEAFEADENDEEREDVRREMENRMREHAHGQTG